MNVDEFFPWLVQQEIKHELVDGQPLMFLGVTSQHADVQLRMLITLGNALAETRWRVLTSQIAVLIPNGNVRYPDLSIDAGAGNQDDMWATDPVLALLIFSSPPSHYAFEGIDQVEDFKSIPSLRYLLRVDAETPRAMLYLRTDSSDWISQKMSLRETVDLPEIGLSFPLADLFAGRNLTTAEAAEYLDCSRPYVIMLCDENKLEGVTRDEQGHRRIPLKSLFEWKNKHSHDGPPAYKEAAAEAGMYDIPDEVWLKKFKRLEEQ